MAKTLSRFYFLKKDEHKEKATLFVRVQAQTEGLMCSLLHVFR